MSQLCKNRYILTIINYTNIYYLPLNQINTDIEIGVIDQINYIINLFIKNDWIWDNNYLMLYIDKNKINITYKKAV